MSSYLRIIPRSGKNAFGSSNVDYATIKYLPWSFPERGHSDLLSHLDAGIDGRGVLRGQPVAVPWMV